MNFFCRYYSLFCHGSASEAVDSLKGLQNWYNHIMDYQEQKKYFERAYKTGTDIWTHMPYRVKGALLTQNLKAGATVLDMGSGRGYWAFELAKLGFKVIGIDYLKGVVEKANKEVVDRSLEGQVRFMEADGLDIPFADHSFDAANDFGLLQHFKPEDFVAYETEIARVVRSGGYFLLTVLSKETRSFLKFSPKGSPEHRFESDGTSYYFFDFEEIRQLFVKDFEIIKEKIEFMPSPYKDVAYISVLMRHK